ncbi:MAG: pyruvate kinase, partial [Chlamydiae bacterium RIFCSPHIGHO2_12_FULL_49_11]
HPHEIPVHPFEALETVPEGSSILFDDGIIPAHVVGKTKRGIEIEMQTASVLTSRRGVNVPGWTLVIDMLTGDDVRDLEFGFKHGIDMIAASFVNSPEHVLKIKKMAKEHGMPRVMVIAKIETKRAVESFDAILQVADGIMVARGDLGVEMPLAKLPILQKKMIRACNKAAKPVITATQMLESMIYSTRPTRAEASDVANAIFDGTSAVMLSGETAAGKYPIQAVSMMDMIVQEAEREFDYIGFFEKSQKYSTHDIPSSIALAAVELSYSSEAASIVVCTNAGQTIRWIAKYRPKSLVVAYTPSELTYNQSSLFWGTVAVMEKAGSRELDFISLSKVMLRKKWASYGDVVVMTSGRPYGKSFSTNTLTVDSIGQFLVRAKPMESGPETVSGETTLYNEIDSDTAKELNDAIVIVTEFNEAMMTLCKKAKAVVLENHPLDVVSITALETFSEKYGVPYLFDADGAASLIGGSRRIRIQFRLGLIFDARSPAEEELLQ